MSGSHYAPQPGPDGRYSLEDTMHDLPVTSPTPQQPQQPQPADSGDYTYTLPASAEWARASSSAAPPDCTVWTARIEAQTSEHDARLRALELAMSTLMVSADTRSLPLTAAATAYLDAVSQACDGQPTLRYAEAALQVAQVIHHAEFQATVAAQNERQTVALEAIALALRARGDDGK